MMEGLPFITFYPAIIVATLLGGPSSGVLSVALSSAAAWYRFIPPALSKKKRFSFFCFIAG